MQGVTTQGNSYCPDYANRDKLNKEGTLDDLLKEWKEKGVMPINPRYASTV